MCARAYLLIVFDVECHRRNALAPKRGAGSSIWYQIWSPGRPPGGAIRCSPLVRERLGLGGWDARPRHGAMRGGFQAPGSTKSASRGVMCEFWGAQMRPSLASQVRSNGFPAGSAAVGASPFSPPTPNGARRGGRDEGHAFKPRGKQGLGTGGLGAARASRGDQIWSPLEPLAVPSPPVPKICFPLGLEARPSSLTHTPRPSRGRRTEWACAHCRRPRRKTV